MIVRMFLGNVRVKGYTLKGHLVYTKLVNV